MTITVKLTVPIFGHKSPTMFVQKPFLVVAFASLFSTTLVAQTLRIDKVGGGIGSSVNFPLRGPASEFYALLFALNEQPTPIPALNVTLDIPLYLAGPVSGLPGFMNFFNAAGTATASTPIPNIPELAQLILSFQALTIPEPGTAGQSVVSNLIRLTPQVPGTFAPCLSQPSIPIIGGSFAPAGAGELLFCGGSGPIAQRYNSNTESWSLSGAALSFGLLSQSTGLPDGRILFTGGIDVGTGQPTAGAAIYDPVLQTTTQLTMNIARAGHGASVMGNGRVLVSGGSATFTFTNILSLFTGISATTEIFDPATNTFAPGPNMLEARAFHTSTTLTNGQVLIAGGLSVLPIINLPTVSSTAYKFNPATNSFGFPAFMNGGRFLQSAAPLSDGKVLIAGGITLDLTTFLTTLNVADIVIGTRTDCQMFATAFFGFGTFTTVNGMSEGRAGAAIAPLPNGGALIAGGFQLLLDISNAQFGFNPTSSADKFAQGPNRLLPTGSMASSRLFPVAANLPDGTVMIVGGGGQAEIYQNQ